MTTSPPKTTTADTQHQLTKGMFSKILTKLEEMRRSAGNVDIELPQICVIGAQSSGKSSLLSSIVGVPHLLPEGSGMVTKCPIIVQLDSGEIEEYRVSSSKTESEKVCDDVPTARECIEEAQEAILSGRKISEDPVSVKYTHPNNPNLVLVDIPGIIQNGDEKDEVIRVIQKYIENPATLIVVVRIADEDEENQAAIDLAKKADPAQERTLQVHTKCDVFSSEDNRKRLHQVLGETRAHENAEKLRPHAVCCRQHGENLLDPRQEVALLKDRFHGVAEQVLGCGGLRIRLEQLLAERVCVNIPNLRNGINENLRSAQAEVELVGQDPRPPSEILGKLSLHLKKLGRSLQKDISKCFSPFKTSIEGTKSFIDKDWVAERFEEDVFQLPFFQGGEVFQECALDIVARWRAIVKDLLGMIKDLLRKQLTLVVDPSSNDILFPRALIKAYNAEWEVHRLQCCEILKENFNELLGRENDFGTTNPYLTAKFQEMMVLPEDKIVKFASNTVPQLQKKHGSEVETLLKQELRKFLKDTFFSQRHEDLREQTIQRVLSIANAHWTVEHKTFLDIALKLLRDDVVKAWDKWVEGIMFNDRVRSAAVEEVAVAMRRKEALETRDRMEDCLEKLIWIENTYGA